MDGYYLSTAQAPNSDFGSRFGISNGNKSMAAVSGYLASEATSSVIGRGSLGLVDYGDAWGKENVSVGEEKETEDGWESASFKEWSKENWACFDQKFKDKFYDLPADKIKGGVDPRSSEWGRLKPGYVGMSTIDPRFPIFEYVLERAPVAARSAVDFYNELKKEEQITCRFHKLSHINHCLCRKRKCYLFFITFEAIDNTGAKKTFQACVNDKRPNYPVRAIRLKPHAP